MLRTVKMLLFRRTQVLKTGVDQKENTKNLNKISFQKIQIKKYNSAQY